MVKDLDDDLNDESGSQTGGEGKGGQTGKIIYRYRDAASLPPRDDALPPGEIKRLLIVHADLHKAYTEKQKVTRKERAALKEGKKILAHRQQLGMGGGGGLSNYKKHPLTNRAQFSGMDKQIIGLPTELEANTNQELQDKLENRYQHRFTPQSAPRLTRH